MKNRIIRASYERAQRLIEAGCPIDNLYALPRQSFRADKLPGYVESCVYAIGPSDTRWVIALRLTTDRASGTIIRGWRFEPPWPDHFIDWDCEPEDVIPSKHLDVYKSLLKSRLVGVLNEGRKIRSGSPVDGVVCGRSLQTIGEYSEGFASAKLGFADDLGNKVQLCIDANVDTHSYSSDRRLPRGQTGQRLLAHHFDSEGRLNLSAVLADFGSEFGPLRGDPRVSDRREHAVKYATSDDEMRAEIARLTRQKLTSPS